VGLGILAKYLFDRSMKNVLNTNDFDEGIRRLHEDLKGSISIDVQARNWWEEEMKKVYGFDPRDVEFVYTEELTASLSSGQIFTKYAALFQRGFTSAEEDRKLIDQVTRTINDNLPLNEQQLLQLFSTFSIEHNYKSNEIEGSTLTYRETELVLNTGFTSAGKPFSDFAVAISLRNAWDRMVKLVQPGSKRNEITLEHILELHSVLAIPLPNSKPGRLRCEIHELVRVKHRETLLSHPLEVNILMQNLLNWLHTTDQHPIDIIVNFHQWFIQIHPFCDGNGRVCRLICALIALQSGYAPFLMNNTTRQVYFDAIHAWENGDTTLFGKVVWKEMLATTKRYYDVVNNLYYQPCRLV